MKYVLYNHGGSANHGCEALVRSICGMLGNENCLLISDAPQEDIKYSVNKLVPIVYSKGKPPFGSLMNAYFQLKLNQNFQMMDAVQCYRALNTISKDDIAISIGGDIYCYGQAPKYVYIDKKVHKRAKKTILLGCSIEPILLKNTKFCDSLKQFDLITARESITYQALKDSGIINVKYYPDTAFMLEMEKCELPKAFQIGNTVGLNISPLVINMAENSDIILKNYECLIRYLLANTAESIALIPHVTWKGNDDREPLYALKQLFPDTDRVFLIEDQSARNLKWIISQCAFFIGARTHATIAAYSTAVPTLAVGYSVKSRGIARDLFGNEKEYLLPYQEINNYHSLLDKYLNLKGREQEMRSTLERKAAEYIKALDKLREELISMK